MLYVDDAQEGCQSASRAGSLLDCRPGTTSEAEEFVGKISHLIAKSIVNVTATGERDALVVKQRAINALGMRKISAA